MKILVIGATGRTGSEFVKQAASAGHQVVAYVRRPEAITPSSHVTAVNGQLDDSKKLSRAAFGCDAIVVTLGPKVSQRNAKLMAMAIPMIIKAAKSAQIKRVIVLSALGAGRTIANTRYPYKLGADTFLKGNFADHEAGESVLRASGLDWTTLHPGPLMNAAQTISPLVRDAATGIKLPGQPRTNRADVAAVMLRILNDNSTFGKQLVMTSAQQES
jgi:uncharacterized protein YbjT (DUF2867 family)